MSLYTFQPQDSPSPDEIKVRELSRQMLDGWNMRSANAFAAQFAEDGESIGFDGSQLIGKTEILSTLKQIFSDHPTAPM